MDVESRIDNMESSIDLFKTETRNEILGVKTTIGEIQTVLLGPLPNRNNGLRGDVRNLRKIVMHAIKWGRDTWNVKRRKECIGVEEVNKLRKELAEKKKKDDGVTSAKMNLKGIYIMSALNLIGMIFMALATGGVFKK